MENWLDYLTDEDIFAFVSSHFDATTYVHDFNRFKKRITRMKDDETGKNKIVVLLDQGKFLKYNAKFTMFEDSCNIQDGMVNPWFSNSRLYQYKTTKNKELMEMVYADYIKLMIKKCGDKYASMLMHKFKHELEEITRMHQFTIKEVEEKVNRRFVIQLKFATDEQRIRAIKETQTRVVGSALHKFNAVYDKKYNELDARYKRIFGKSIFDDNVKKPIIKMEL